MCDVKPRRSVPVLVFAYNAFMLITGDVLYVKQGLGTGGCMLITIICPYRVLV